MNKSLFEEIKQNHAAQTETGVPGILGAVAHADREALIKMVGLQQEEIERLRGELKQERTISEEQNAELKRWRACKDLE